VRRLSGEGAFCEYDVGRARKHKGGARRAARSYPDRRAIVPSNSFSCLFRERPYRPNFWNLMRLGMISLTPRRRILSSS
jgi:hypothetical protein